MLPSQSLLKHGSDKVTTHSYGPLYDSIFSGGTIRSVLEVGVQDGKSLRAWAESVAEGGAVYGMDILPAPADLPESCRFARADATDIEPVLQSLNLWGIVPCSLDLVIDDGSHVFKDQLATHALLWEYVRPGGWYVIEDIDPKTFLPPFFRLGGSFCDFRLVKNRYDDVAILFHKPR